MMKSRIETVFESLNKQNEKALITFITCGDPDIETTYNLVLEMEKAGSSIVELGIPYSDPLADGEIIQRASKRALDNGINIIKCLDLVKSLRKVTQIPLVFLVYFNPIFQYGIEAFINKCIEVGIDGLIIPDLPLEERTCINRLLEDEPLNLIPMVAPTSKSRIKNIVENSRGFVYCVSSKGVTGKRSAFDSDLDAFIQEVKRHTDTPAAIGFGISNRETVEKLKPFSDGLIVGSAIIEKIEEGLNNRNIERQVYDFVHELYLGISQKNK